MPQPTIFAISPTSTRSTPWRSRSWPPRDARDRHPRARPADDSLFENDGQLTKARDPRLDPLRLAPKARRVVVGHRRRCGLHRHRMVPAPSAQPRHRHRRAQPSAPNARAATRRSLAQRISNRRIGRAPGGACATCRRRMPIFIGGGGSEAGVFDAAWAALKPADGSSSMP